MKARNIGRFVVGARFFDGLARGEGANLFHGLIVLDLQRNWVSGTGEYTALHEQFRDIAEGEMAPQYMATFRDGESTPTWVEMAPLAEVVA